MSKKWEELTNEFDAESEDGQCFRIQIYTTMIDSSSLSNPNAAPLKGLRTARTSDGYHCNRIDDDNWEIVELGLKVTRVS